MSVSLTALQEDFAATGIAAIRRIFTSANIPPGLQARDLPVLMPDPSRPVENSTSTRLTMGGAGWVRTRILNYLCFVAEAGTGRTPADHAELLAQCIDGVENALCDWRPDGCHGLPTVIVGAAVQITDPAGKSFLGFPVAVTVTMSY